MAVASWPVTASRWLSQERRYAAVKTMSSSSDGASRSRAARRPAAWRSAGSAAAVTIRTYGGAWRGGGAAGSGTSGGCSTSTCALLPLNPNALTPGPPRRGPAEPLPPLGRPPDRQPVPVDVRRGPVHAVRRELAVVERQHHLEQPGDARRGLEVPDVGLGRADQQPASAGGRAQRLGERADLDRVAERRARAVCLDIVDVARLPSPRRSSARR